MSDQENLEMDDILERITFYCLDTAQAKLVEGEELTPFTVIVDGDQMFEENFPGDDVTSCRDAAEANVKSSSAFSTHYAFCYDGFLMTDDGQLDAIIVECATTEMEEAYVIARLYGQEGDTLVFEETPAYVDDVDTFYDLAAVRAAKARAEVLARKATRWKRSSSASRPCWVVAAPRVVTAAGGRRIDEDDQHHTWTERGVTWPPTIIGGRQRLCSAS